METTYNTRIDGSSDQELVDLYASNVPHTSDTSVSDRQIETASGAAHTLETRGYVEQAGTWVHHTRPALHATG